jgi:diguanylate cyclase (GGDEF)-like protein/PAS domain S-box-containing protein
VLFFESMANMPQFLFQMPSKSPCCKTLFQLKFNTIAPDFFRRCRLMPNRRNIPRVLIVDDDVNVRALLRRFFSGLGLQVIEAENPFAALGRMAEGPFELAVTDVNMPERTGVWLLEELRSRAPELPVVVMTAGELQASGLRAVFGLDVRVVRKPFELGELETVVRELIPHVVEARYAAQIAPVPEERAVLSDKPYSYASTLLAEMLARTVGLETQGVPWQGRIHADDLKRIEDEAREALREGRRFRLEYRLLTVDNEIIWVLHEAPLTADPAGLPVFGPGALLDVTARKRDEMSLRASEERHRFLTEHSTDMITVQSEDGQYIYVSPACYMLLGYDPGELAGRSFNDLVHRDDMNKVREYLADVLERPIMATVDYRVRRRDRRYVWFETTSRTINRSDPFLTKEVISVSRDITERKLNEERLRELAILDDLTGLYNRRGFIALAQQQLKAARRAKRGALLLFADLNNLKYINDTLGHKDGDQALIDAAHIFNRTFRDSDVVARVGGDEFAILAVESDAQHLESIRARIDSALQLANSDRARSFELSISIGAAAYDPCRDDSVEELLAWADRAMYEHKRSRPSSVPAKFTSPFN